MGEPLPRDGAEPEKPRREFRFKSREFPVANAPASAPSDQPTDVQQHLRIAGLGNIAFNSAPPARPENEVHQILRGNVAHANAAGLNDVKPVAPRRSRRLFDYIVVTLAANLLIGGVAWAFRRDGIVLLFALAGAVLFNIQLAWRMWVVMDDY